MGYYDDVKFNELLGKTLTKIELKNDDPDEQEEHNDSDNDNNFSDHDNENDEF